MNDRILVLQSVCKNFCSRCSAHIAEPLRESALNDFLRLCYLTLLRETLQQKKTKQTVIRRQEKQREANRARGGAPSVRLAYVRALMLKSLLS